MLKRIPYAGATADSEQKVENIFVARHIAKPHVHALNDKYTSYQ